ncbi:LysR family transcriptional regulator [Roseomonas sp. GC11]|uniref:LysR family transcriptional regulator n=1 Tax=Roseomonas sp. GC11 TaxID=2950546 RepID=UPI00210A9CAE|nr:LysR family transcriptional regulator [Roseomonas sp. GC11]MCQ4160327.1 LysR family transcriptional regulator [Roseomonas sp. GC11]
MRDHLDGVGVFVEAVEAGGFARAAERLALSRSAVGKSVARLEARLGTRLFHRTTRTQQLTEDGQIYYERCLKALEELRAGESLIDSGRREVVGPLKVSMPRLFGRHCVAPILLDIAREHPGLELDLRFSDTLVDMIGERFDLAIRNGAPGEGGALSTRRIATQAKIICAAPAYLAARGLPRGIEELAAHDALVYWRGERLFPWTLPDATGRLVEAKLRWRLQSDDHEAIVEAATQGMGLAWVPAWLVRAQLAAGQLVVVPGFPSPPLESFAVWPGARHLPLRLRVAIDRLARELQSRIDLPA